MDGPFFERDMQQRGSLSSFGLALVGSGLLACTGCTDPFGRIDSDIDALTLERSTVLGGGAISPDVDRSDPGERPGQAETRLETVNPGPDELRYDPAGENERFVERLDRYDSEASTEARMITLTEALQIAQVSSRDYLSAQEDYIIAAISLLIERHEWGPRLFNTLETSMFAAADAGLFDHTFRIMNTLGVTQRLPYGGQVEARWVATMTDMLREDSTQSYTESSRIILSAEIPLLRGAGLVAREDLIQSERNLIYGARVFERFRRSQLVGIARDYFALLQSKSRIANQLRQIEGLEFENARTTASVEAGRLRPFQLRITENRLNSARSQLQSLRESYRAQLEAFKRRIGLDVSEPIDIADISLDLQPPKLTQDEASELALEFRLDLQNARDSVDDARRAVRNSKNAVLPDLDLAGQVGIPTDPNQTVGLLDLDGDFLDYSVGVTLDVPLDRRIERLRVREATIRYQRSVRSFEDLRDQVIISARQSLRNIDLALYQLELAEAQVVINELGLEDLGQRDDADPQSVIDASNDLLQSEDERDAAVADLRNAILDFLLQTGQLRVARDGTFTPLQGMDFAEPNAAQN